MDTQAATQSLRFRKRKGLQGSKSRGGFALPATIADRARMLINANPSFLPGGWIGSGMDAAVMGSAGVCSFMSMGALCCCGAGVYPRPHVMPLPNRVMLANRGMS
jgi:hypothetical protein